MVRKERKCRPVYEGDNMGRTGKFQRGGGKGEMTLAFKEERRNRGR